MTLDLLDSSFLICRLEPNDPIPSWATAGSFFNIARTGSELSLVCESSRVPKGIRVEGPWRAFRVEGPLDFALVGILSSLLEPLAEARVSVFALSTFDTDYILVKEAKHEAAVEALANAGHDVRRTTA